MGLNLRIPLRKLSDENLKRQYRRAQAQISELVAQQHHLANEGLPRKWVDGDTGPYRSRRDNRDYAADQLDERQVARSLARMNRAVGRIDALLRRRGIDPTTL